MTRVGEYVAHPNNGNGVWRSSPTDVFSSDIVNMERRKESNESKGKFWKPIALLCSVAAILFFICAVALVGLVVVKYVRDEDKPEEGHHHEQQVSIDDSLHPFREEMKDGRPATQTVDQSRPKTKLRWPLPSGSMYTSFRRASIATDHGLCSEVGRDVMMQGGNAVEATIASLLCIGVVNPQSSGLGGGFLMTLFNKTTGRCITIDARETAPAAATQDMYVEHPVDASYGYRSIAVPSELHGFYTAFTRFGSGKVAWRRLVEPAMNLASRGFPVSNNLADVLKRKEKHIMIDEHMTKEFVNPVTGRVYEEGDMMRREALAKTLELIGNDSDPIGLFYRHGMAQSITAEFHRNGAHVTAHDLADYRTQIEETPLVVEDLPGGLSMCGPPPPSSFVVLQAIVRTMARFYNGTGPKNLDDPLVYHRLIETMKFAYAQRAKLGDTRYVQSAAELVSKMITPNFITSIVNKIKDHALPMEDYVDVPMSMPEDHGTSHVSAIDEEGNAVSCTSTVNQLLGSMKISPTLGIIWNDEMDDFSTPGQANLFGFAPSETNFIAPGKRPMSSMSPVIIYSKDGEVKMVSGAAGGSFIISSVAQAIIHTLFFNQTVKESLDAPRFHHQYLPHKTDYEYTVPAEIIDALRTRYQQNMTVVDKIASVVQSLQVNDDGYIHGNSDWRRKTSTYPSGF
ncbi:hypothetical protein PRIPAC_75313 [Pristionchus pacificus]|uniref:Uncharacterized protein n=1 Tax=Pristionchus pacificus TaxID=54126 RepID=A0A2A6BRC6_PRIPA|nr:hypothetical protein PRIPAC_75313 [Pristionchus pacificus]|eukprot:PDM68417.1 hypothetical protein PRIPAC_43919 [Pristionchus pacificus]